MTKLNMTNCLIAKDPSLMFLIVKIARDQPNQSFSSLTLGSGKMKDPGTRLIIQLKHAKVLTV